MLTKNYLRTLIRTHVAVFFHEWSSSIGSKCSSTSTIFKDDLASLVYDLDYGVVKKPVDLPQVKEEFRKIHITITDVENVVRRIMKTDFIREILFSRKLQDFGKYYVLSENENKIKVSMQGFLNRWDLEWSSVDQRSRILAKAGMIEHLLNHELHYIINQENRVMKRGQIGVYQPTKDVDKSSHLRVYGRLIEYDITSDSEISFKIHKISESCKKLKSKSKHSFVHQYSNEEVAIIFRRTLNKLGAFKNVSQLSSRSDHYTIKVSFDNNFLVDTKSSECASNAIKYDPLIVKIESLTKDIETKRNQLTKAEELCIRHKSSLEDLQNDLIILQKAQEIVLK